SSSSRYSSTFLSCSSVSSPVVLSVSCMAPLPKSHYDLPARVERPEPREIGGAVVALHRLERLHAARLLARVDLGIAEGELGVLRALETALLDALLHEVDALVGLAFEGVVQADLHEVVAFLRGERLRLFLR